MNVFQCLDQPCNKSLDNKKYEIKAGMENRDICETAEVFEITFVGGKDYIVNRLPPDKFRMP